MYWLDYYYKNRRLWMCTTVGCKMKAKSEIIGTEGRPGILDKTNTHLQPSRTEKHKIYETKPEC